MFKKIIKLNYLFLLTPDFAFVLHQLHEFDEDFDWTHSQLVAEWKSFDFIHTLIYLFYICAENIPAVLTQNTRGSLCVLCMKQGLCMNS